MPKYNLDSLGSEEFERLCQSLIQEIIGPGAKVYGMGKDGAREATFHGKANYPSAEEQWDGDWIFQAKFHDIQHMGPKKARETLIAELDDELSKITEKYEYKCDNYILMTNVSLTPVFQKGTKDRIDHKVVPKYKSKIKNIHVLGGDEICRFLDSHTGIRKTYSNFLVTGDVIAHLLKLIEVEKTDLEEQIELYCQGCFIHEQYAALDDAGDVEDERIALQRVFIDLDVRPPDLLKERLTMEKLPDWLSQAAEDDERSSALSYLLDDSIMGLVLIGGPGEGKSTLGQYVVQIHRGRLIGKLDELGENVEVLEKCIPRIPFRVLLREYAQWISSSQNSTSLFDYLAGDVSRESGRSATCESIHKIIKSNPTVLILDGLDEVPEKTLRKKVLDNISSFVAQVRDVLKGNLRVIATTRPSGYSEEFDPNHYLHLSLQKLSNEKATIYANRWAEAREPNPQEKERIQTTFNMCLKDKVVSVLTQTPLQVTILLVIIRARGTPPKQREELFERYMDVIYQREQKKRPELLRTEADMIYSLHKYLAYILHRRAEKDRTAALMDVPEFRENVQKYLMHSNPLLNEDEVKGKTSQIMTEASQRLVLIESPQEGKVGFGLTTTREFFAAAHLVDTAKDTKERDLRFKAITRRPYWRNVALFFAGRVGRTRPGETASMVDVCREVDTERADKFLKRGAELVMEMVDDRVLREPHNEIGAIQYELTILDAEYIKELKDSIDKLTALSDPYKERVVRPWLEEKLRSGQLDNISAYVDTYRTMFGVSDLLIGAIKEAAKSNLENVKLWALSEAIRDNIVEQWVIDLLETVVESVSTYKVAQAITSHLNNIISYCSFSMSPKAMTAIAIALVIHVRFESQKELSETLDGLSELESVGEYKEISILLFGVSKLCRWALFDLGADYPRGEHKVNSHFPKLAIPNIRQEITENAKLMKYFCNTLSYVDVPFIKFLVAIIEFLLEPENFVKYSLLSKYQLQKGLTEMRLTWIASSLIGSTTKDKTEEHCYHKDLCTLFRLCKSEQKLNATISEFNQIMNSKAKETSNHPHRLRMWMEYGCDPDIEKSLDRKILSEANEWLKSKGLSKNIGHLLGFSYSLESDLAIYEMELKRIKKQLEEGHYIHVDRGAFYYEWHVPLTKKEAKIATELKDIFETVLNTYPRGGRSELREIEILYWSALDARIIEEKHMVMLYEIARNDSRFGYKHLLAREYNSTKDALIDMIQRKTPGIAALAAVSLIGLIEIRSSWYEEQIRIEVDWIGEKLWELAKETDNNWNAKLIEGMKFCNLRWGEKGREWLEAIAETNTQELRNGWCKVIEQAGYSELVDQDALFNFILEILESENKFEKSVRVSALCRLHRLAIEAESTEFDEEALNLPLGRRGS